MTTVISPVLQMFRAALDAMYGERIERVVLYGSQARTSRKSNIGLVRFDNISVDWKKMEVLRDGEIVVLTAQEFKILQFLVHNPDRMISRDELLKEVWGYQNYILRLRQKLERDLASPSALPHGTWDRLQVRPLRSSCSGAGAATLHHAAF
jgi:DNA-binding response OmpR family regulator